MTNPKWSLVGHKTEKSRGQGGFQAWLHTGVRTVSSGPSFLGLFVRPCSPGCVVFDRFLICGHKKATAAPKPFIHCNLYPAGRENLSPLPLNSVHKVLGPTPVGLIRPCDHICTHPSA